MSDSAGYTPETSHVRTYYVLAGTDSWDPERDEALHQERGEAFDRWLAAVRADAVREGYEAARQGVGLPLKR